MTNENLATALAELQQKLPKVTKGETATVRSDKGSYSYSYADLTDITDQLMPIMGDLGLSFIAKPTFMNGSFVLAYSLLHTSGEREDGHYPLPGTGTPQQIGSAITYGRRYCLCAVTGVAPGGDDNDAANVPSMDVYRRAEVPAHDWRGEADAVPDLDEARALWKRAKGAGADAETLKYIADRSTAFADEHAMQDQYAAEKAKEAAEASPAPARPDDPATQKQVGLVNGLLKKAGHENDEQRYAKLSELLSREIASSKELTKGEAHDVIETLQADQS
jgi:hypothetical protein